MIGRLKIIQMMIVITFFIYIAYRFGLEEGKLRININTLLPSSHTTDYWHGYVQGEFESLNRLIKTDTFDFPIKLKSDGKIHILKCYWKLGKCEEDMEWK